MTIFSVRHSTVYRYVRPVAFGEHRLMFRPRDSFDQRLLEATLVVEPEPTRIRWIHDVFGNCVALIDMTATASELSFHSHIRLDHTPDVALDLQIDEKALTYPFAYANDEIADLERTIERHYPDQDDEVGRGAKQFVRVGHPTETFSSGTNSSSQGCVF